MKATTVHIEGFNQKGPVCGAGGLPRIDRDWDETDSSTNLRRCTPCDKKLGPAGLEALKKARRDLDGLREATAAGHAARTAGRRNGSDAYPDGSLAQEAYSNGYEKAGHQDPPAKTTAVTTELVATLESAIARASSYNQNERNIITWAVNRANRRLADRTD